MWGGKPASEYEVSTLAMPPMPAGSGPTIATLMVRDLVVFTLEESL
jgi:hypothetical protein